MNLKLSPDTFVPRKKIWILIQNKDYSDARSGKALQTLKDMTNADEKVKAVVEGIKNLGAIDSEIRSYENASRNDFAAIFDELTEEVRLD